MTPHELSHPDFRRRTRSPAGHCLESALDSVLAWLDRRRQRLRLQALDDRLLKDIGLSRADVEREARRPFWRP